MPLVETHWHAEGLRLRFTLCDSTSPSAAGLTGLVYNTANLNIATICDCEATTTAYTATGSTIETIATLGTFAAPTATKCRFKEVDATNHPGLYELQLANARLAVAGATSMVVTIIGAANLAQCNFTIALRSIDEVMLDEAIRQGYRPDNSVIVAIATTDAERGVNLRAAYAAAKLLTPNGAAIGATNPVRVFLPPAWYDVGSTSLTCDTNDIDLIALLPEAGGKRKPSDKEDASSDAWNGFHPPRTLIYSSQNGVQAVVQSCSRMRTLGIAVAQFSTSFVTNNSGWYVSSDSTAGSWHKLFYGWTLVGTDGTNALKFSKHVAGVWEDFIVSSRTLRNGLDAEDASQFSAALYDGQVGEFSVIGDYTAGHEGTHKATQSWIQRVYAIGGAVGSGYGSFSGCTTWATDIDSTNVWMDIWAGNNSYAPGAKHQGVMIRCYGGDNCAGGTISDTYPGEFAGVAIDCHFEDNSLGGTAYAATLGKLTGTVIGCTVRNNGKAHRIDGATIVDSTFLSKVVYDPTDEELTNPLYYDVFTLLDSDCKIHNSTLLPAGGSAVPINAATALSVSASGNRYGNKSAAAFGLGANVTNTATEDKLPPASISSTTFDNSTAYPLTLADNLTFDQAMTALMAINLGVVSVNTANPSAIVGTYYQRDGVTPSVVVTYSTVDGVRSSVSLP